MTVDVFTLGILAIVGLTGFAFVSAYLANR